MSASRIRSRLIPAPPSTVSVCGEGARAAIGGQEREGVVASIATHRHRAGAVTAGKVKNVVGAAAIDDDIARAGELNRRGFRSPRCR